MIGYVSDVSQRDLESSELIRNINVPGLKTGKNGLEKSLNDKIIGLPGLQRFEVNAYGKRVKELEFIQGQQGKNFKTTLDKEVQVFANELLKEKSGSICVMDIFTGDIIAMVSSPTFDANKFVKGISRKDWNDLIFRTLKVFSESTNSRIAILALISVLFLIYLDNKFIGVDALIVVVSGDSI